ncbi:K02A2.6-like [Cordylochernes scorpioides]|uniref:RNA-directed DNA polymerase n=1 Tax=Cordylochernes scorpioides TaxID=51811 RepID=A0ABY6LF17_9ARAC|nr:K02A2.6-like [Cordylochernes scorpioides]
MPGHRKRRQFKQTDAFTRGMVIGLKRAGWSIRQIAADTHLGASTVHRPWRRWLEQGNVAIYRNAGATRVTSARVDRRILRQAVAAPQATCTAILQHVQDTLDHSISTRTISRRLVANGLHSCRPLRRLPLTPPNRRQRLEWCRARSTWMTEWHRVVFSDESRFCLSSDSRRVRVWRRRGERSNPAAIVERPTVRQRGIMVWGAIAYDSRSPLLRIQGTMTAQRYVDDVLRPVTLPYLQGVPNALYQEDNARPHTARISQQALQDVQMLPWPPYSPDLSPIEHVWDIIGRRLHALPQPRSEDELWQMVEREWRAIPQDAIRTLIDSLPRRVAACIAVRGKDLNCYLEQLEECFKLNKTLEADKVSVLLTSIDVNVYKTLRDLLVPRRPSDLKYKDLVDVLTNHLYPIKNKHYERYLFHKIVQKENEPVGKFVLRLKSQADNCKFTDINENLCDQFVSGCFDEATLKRLLSEPFLTFDSAINIANSVEAAKSQVNLMKNPGHDIDKLKARSKNFKFPCKYNNPCKICGKSNHDTKLCKFKNAQCYICNKKGHIAPVCWNKKSAQNSGMNKPNLNKLNTIQCSTLENAPKILVNVKIEDADTIMEVATGADVSVVSKKFFLTNLKNVTLEKYSGHLKSFSGNMIPVFGKCLVNVSYKNYQEKLPLIVTGQFNNQTPLLGRNWIRILKTDWLNCVFDICNNINVISNLELFLEVYKRVFENKDLPIQGIKGSISLRPNAKPKFFKFRPVPFSIKEKIDKELDRLEKSQIIEKVNASDWSTPLVTVIKSNGELRLCGDFKNTLNNCIEDEKYPLPTIETMLGNLGGNKIFTKLDLSSAYHQIEMDEASKNLLVVSTHRGLYRYNRLPFGISPASAIFQRCMDSLFHDVPNTVIYLDDIFIGSKDEQEHYRILKMIFDKLKELNFTLNKEKCLFLKKGICFLGHIINEDGVRPDSKKLEALERCKKPFDKTSLKSFLGMLSFYSKYIPNMSTLAGPLYQLLKKDNRWKWSSQCEKAFLNLKLTLLNSQALIHYSMKLPLTLTCDASAYGISGVLCHIVEREEKPITFVSRTLSSAEVKYSQTEKEALAIVFATSKLRQYLFGRKFVLKSDHKALTTVFGNKRLLPPLIANRLHRWALELSNFDFDIRYTNKDTMLCADAFSRLPLEEINSREDNIDLVTHDISFLNVTPLDHLIIEEETNKDPVLNKLKEYLLEDPQLAKKDETMKPFLSKLENFSVLQGCIFVDSRAVIPRTCQDQMLKLLHQSHIGINRMKSLARSSVWWPKMDSQIEEFVKECSPCMHHQTAPPAENTPWPRTNQPWQRVHVDHFYFRGDCYLLVVDANSNWIEVFPARGTTSQENIKLLRECFARNTPTSLDKPPVERLLSYVPRTFVNCLNSEFIQKTFGRNECGRRHFQVGDKVLFTRVIQNRRKWFKAQVIRRLGYNVYLVKNLKGTFKVHVNQMRTGSDTKYAEDSDWTLDNAGAGPHRLEQNPQISTSPPPRRSTRPRCPPCRTGRTLRELERVIKLRSRLTGALGIIRTTTDQLIQNDQMKIIDSTHFAHYKFLSESFMTEEYLRLNISLPNKRLVAQHRVLWQFFMEERKDFWKENGRNCLLCKDLMDYNLVHYFFQCPILTEKRTEIFPSPNFGQFRYHRICQLLSSALDGELLIVRYFKFCTEAGRMRKNAGQRILEDDLSRDFSLPSSLSLMNISKVEEEELEEKAIETINPIQPSPQKPTKKKSLTPKYKIQRFHELKVGDFEKHQEFAACVFLQIDIDENWLSNVLWTDEAHFSLNGEFNTQNSRIWATENPRIFTEMPLYQDGSGRPRATTEREDRAIVRMAVAAPESTLSTIQRVTGTQVSKMIINRTPLVVIPGTLTAQQYVDDILRPALLPFHSHHPRLTFQQDNAQAHTARVTMDCLQSCRTLPWPARSLDLSPIEHIWDVMGRRLQPSRNVDYLARQLETIWQEIPQHTIRNLYQSMTRWGAACIQVSGGPTTY